MEQQLSELEGRLAAVEQGNLAGQQPLMLYIMQVVLLLMLVLIGWFIVRMGLLVGGCKWRRISWLRDLLAGCYQISLCKSSG